MNVFWLYKIIARNKSVNKILEERWRAKNRTARRRVYVGTNEQEKELKWKREKFYEEKYFSVYRTLSVNWHTYLKLGMLFPFTKLVGCLMWSTSFASKIFEAVDVGLVKWSSPVSRLLWVSWDENYTLNYICSNVTKKKKNTACLPIILLCGFFFFLGNWYTYFPHDTHFQCSRRGQRMNETNKTSRQPMKRSQNHSAALYDCVVSPEQCDYKEVILYCEY